MLVYNPEPTSATVTGLHVAYRRRWPVRQRALLAKALVRGDLIMTPLTRTQAALICGVPYQKLVEALNAREPESLARHFARCSEAERIEAAREIKREIGPDAVWDTMVLPLL